MGRLHLRLLTRIDEVHRGGRETGSLLHIVGITLSELVREVQSQCENDVLVEVVAFCLNRHYTVLKLGSRSWCLVVACASHHIGAMLEPEAVERVCWHREVKLHRPLGGGHQNLLTAGAKMVNVLSAPEQDSF